MPGDVPYGTLNQPTKESVSMAQYETRTKTSIRHEYVVPNPVNWTEVGKAFSAAKRDYEDAYGRTTDDSIWVTHADEDIIIYWEEVK